MHTHTLMGGEWEVKHAVTVPVYFNDTNKHTHTLIHVRHDSRRDLSYVQHALMAG